jgi:hypothetical protein
MAENDRVDEAVRQMREEIAYLRETVDDLEESVVARDVVRIEFCLGRVRGSLNHLAGFIADEGREDGA